MRKLLAALALIAAPAFGQVCDQSFNLRTTACPAGALDCTNKGSTLTSSEVDANFVNVIDLCKPFDVASTALSVQGDWTFLGTLAVPADTIDAITEIATALKSGLDTTLVTGTVSVGSRCMESNADGDIVESTGACLTSGTDLIGTDELDDGSSTPAVNKIVKVDSASTAQFEYSDCTLSDAGALDCPAPATAGGSMTLKEGQDDGTDTFVLKVPDTGLSGDKTCTLMADGELHPDCIESTGQVDGDVLTWNTGDTMSWDAPSGSAFPQVRSMPFPAASLSSDGTQCADPTEVTLNSGPKTFTISCADNAASIVYGAVPMPEGWNAGTVTFEIWVWHGTTESITFAGDFSAQCRGTGEIPSSTWGTGVDADVSITTANQIVSATTSTAVTAAGTCAAGDMMFWRWVMDDATSDANAANSDIVAINMEYTASAAD